MDNGGTLTTAIGKQADWDQHKSDVLLDTKDMHIKWLSDRAEFGLFNKEDEGGHTFTDHSLTQFCNVTGMDRGLWERVRTEGNTSVATQWQEFVNKALEEEFGLGRSNPTRLLRLYTDTTRKMVFLRACLSSRYAPVSIMDILVRTQEAMDELDKKGIGFKVFQISQDIDRLWVRLISSERLEHGEGYLYAGVQIGNSEDGTQVISCEGFVGDGFCTNGIIFGQRQTDQQKEATFHRKHIGTTNVILKHRFNLAIAESFQMSCDMMERFLGLKDKSVADPLDEIVSIVLKRKGKQGFNESFAREAQGAYPIYRTHHGDNMFSVISALTQASQNLTDSDRIAVEKEMGALVTTLTSTR